MDALWAVATWLADEPSRIMGLLCLVVVVGLFGGYFTRHKGRHRR